MNDTKPAAGAFPAFFGDAPTVLLRDPLAAFLGAGDGFIEYAYADAVKLAGHSCPTVASAFLMTRAALAALYPDSVPVRGEVRVELRDGLEEGVAGVIGSVAGLLTGAAAQGGFQGIAGRFGRRNLLAYGVAMPTQLRFTRTDTGESVGVSAHLEHVAPDPRQRELLMRALGSGGAGADQAQFGAAWQDRVRRLLLQHADDPEVIEVTREQGAAAPGAGREGVANV
jgi:hypothetical protein